MFPISTFVAYVDDTTLFMLLVRVRGAVVFLKTFLKLGGPGVNTLRVLRPKALVEPAPDAAIAAVTSVSRASVPPTVGQYNCKTPVSDAVRLSVIVPVPFLKSMGLSMYRDFTVLEEIETPYLFAPE